MRGKVRSGVVASTVNALAPGYYGTEPNRAYFDSNPELRDKVLDLIPLHRLGTIEELAALVVALCPDATGLPQSRHATFRSLCGQFMIP